MRTYIKDLNKYISENAEERESVTVMGWVKVRRDQGKMIFLDLRDTTGMVQGVILPNHTDALTIGNILRTEWCVEVTGLVNKRPERNVKIGVVNGELELEITGIKVLNESETPAFDLTTDGKEVNEEVRLRYRYMDMRRDRVSKNIKNRFKAQQLVRNYFQGKDFVEVETPLMSAPTLEGSRSYVVPSRVWKGNFYSLPQSPQQYKQLLMVGGLEKYFQFARCMRDEDTRGDRQPEFTQMDFEMSFATEEDIMNINEEVLIKIVKDLYPEKRIQQIPFPRISYKESMEKYGNDKPDIREDKTDENLLAFCWITDFPMFEKTGEDNVDGTGEWTFTHNPFSKPREEYMHDFMNKKDIGNILTTQYDVSLNGYEIGGGSLRNYKAEALKKTFEIMGYTDAKIDEMFGHMIDAMKFGAPPHGGIAWGFDRLMMILENEPNIREVIPFPKTGEGKDLLMNAPGMISDKQKRELNIK
jgi:aspartyl-tRNA synthetase